MNSEDKYPVIEEPIFKEFCGNRELAENSIRLYKVYLQKYSDFTGKKLEELIEEAEDEEDNGIRLRKRKITKYLNDFKRYIDETDYSESYKKNSLVSIKAFYNEYDIQLPKNKRRKTRSDKKPVETIEDLPTAEEIKMFLEKCNPTYKAILTVGISSGMGRSEIHSLTFKHFYNAIPIEPYPSTIPEILEKLKAKDNLIPLWRIKRVKTGHPYFTFSSPESIEYIIKYLERLNFKFPDYEPDPSDQFFRTLKFNSPLGYHTIGKNYIEVCKSLGIRKVNGKYAVRSHSLRKYFATTLESNKMHHLHTRWLLGHKIDDTTDAYFKADPEALKEDYIDLVDQLTTDKVKVVLVDKYESISQRVDEIENELEKGFVTNKYKIDPDTKDLIKNTDKRILKQILEANEDIIDGYKYEDELMESRIKNDKVEMEHYRKKYKKEEPE